MILFGYEYRFGKTFGSSARVKIIRLFLSNPENVFSLDDVSRRAKVLTPSAKREISLFKSVGLIKQRDETTDEIIKLKDGTEKNKKKKFNGYFLNVLFPFVHALRNLVINAAPADKEAMIKEINTIGRIKLVVFPVSSPTAKTREWTCFLSEIP